LNAKGVKIWKAVVGANVMVVMQSSSWGTE
jgi:hypothetical protein